MPRRHRAVVAGLAIAAVSVAVLLAIVVLPVRTDARGLTVNSGAPAVTVFSVSGPTWMTVHFDRHGSAGMIYWMNGPSGVMFNRTMMGGGAMMGGQAGSDSYSFWTWGGDYRCAAEYSGTGTGSMQVWINMTSGIW